MRMRRIITCGMYGSTVFFDITSKRARCSERVTEHKTCFDFLYSFVWNISLSKKNWAAYDKECVLVLCKVPVIIVRF